MPKIFALRSRLLEVQNSLLCNPLAHGAGKGDGVGPCPALDEGARKAQAGQQPAWACGTAWDEDWGSSLLVGDHAAASNSDIIEVAEPEGVAEEEKGEGEDDTGKIA